MKKQKTLKELREQYGISQSKLAEAFEVSSSTIYNHEKDSSKISDSLLKKYMYTFDIKYDDIFLGNKYDIFVFENKNKSTVFERAKDLTP
ncbi:helix-turn-helix transcriptional regulator [Carnobacterium inhibens]|uniref:helix-turn-helix transcriptional regulator n=1 Tax=Carnobacterium inhibens TaxID=147709 RepID=UPI000559758A|nr:helix-turn-helix transcriptional regulator [Carnobacterium inhibens]